MRYSLDLTVRRLVKPPKTSPSNSLERALIVLDRIARKPGGLSNKQISEELGIATSSCSYVLSRLEREGYLARNAATGRYEIGLKVLSIAQGALRQMDFRKVAGPVLRQLAADTGLDVVMGVLDQEKLVIVSRVATSEFREVDVDTGTEFPAHATAIGKILLAHLPKEELQSLIQKNGLAQVTEKTITRADRLMAELEAVRERGYSTCEEEHTLGLRSVGAPIVDPWGGIPAALAAAGGLKDPMWEKGMPEVAGIVKAAAREISRLGRLRWSSTASRPTPWR
jgi:IclR family transcriptional regulator, KDG regulon repressor